MKPTIVLLALFMVACGNSSPSPIAPGPGPGTGPDPVDGGQWGQRAPLIEQHMVGRVQIDVPIVIRLDGTNADLGREILEPHLSDRLRMQPTMIDAAQTAVALAAR